MRSAGFVVMVLLLALASSAQAEDEKSEVWVFEKGPVRRELDVTHMPEELRASLVAQLEAGGWKRVAAAGAANEEASAKDEAPPPKPPPVPVLPKPESSLRKDLEELVKRGGKLPSDFVPHETLARGADSVQSALGRILGQLILEYLAAKDDDVKAPVYERVLRDLAGEMTRGTDAPASYPAVMRRLSQVRNRYRAALGDGEFRRATAIRRILDVFATHLKGALPDRRPPDLGGARLALLGEGGSAALMVLSVPTGSLAQEMGLRAGDTILAIDGRPADFPGLRRARKAVREAGQLTLRVRRMDGRIEQLDIEFEVEDRRER
jgi:hypothetical protein